MKLTMKFAMVSLVMLLNAGAANAADQDRVEKTRGDVVFYQLLDDGNHVRMDPQPVVQSLAGATIRQQTRGYYLVDTGQGEFWVHRSNIALGKEKPLTARCGGISVASSYEQKVARGAGQGCAK